jgi:hypothetical protein
MHFYFWAKIPKSNRPGIYRRAHIVNEEADGECLCKCPINLRLWTLVEKLPEGTHLCKRCKRLWLRSISVYVEIEL